MMKKRIGDLVRYKKYEGYGRIYKAHCNWVADNTRQDSTTVKLPRQAILNQSRYNKSPLMIENEPDINTRIWQVVALIPKGCVATYGDVARMAGLPGAARRVGAALRGLPKNTRIPWHRVVNAQGRLSLPEGSPSRALQKDRLEAEGITFRNKLSLNMIKYRWHP